MSVEKKRKNQGRKKKNGDDVVVLTTRIDDKRRALVACRFVSYRRPNGTKRDCRRYRNTQERDRPTAQEHDPMITPALAGPSPDC